MRLDASTVAGLKEAAGKASLRASGYGLAGERGQAARWNETARQLNYAATALSLALDGLSDCRYSG